MQDFPGCVIVVSHDRYFMDKVVDHLLVFKGQGVIKDFPGNYTQYRQWEALASKEEQQNKKQGKNRGTGTPGNSGEGGTSGKPGEPEKPEKTEPTRKRKMSYKEKREFEQLESDIATLEAEQKAIEEALCSGTLSIDELTEKSIRLPKLKEELDEKSMRWLELSEIGA
jgi:ATP-binding cassette subfamily F protein uup